MHKSRLGNIVIDCSTEDLTKDALFWSAALGCPLPRDLEENSPFIQLQTPPGDLQVVLQRVDHAPRVHLDIETDSIEAEVTRLEALGATVVVRKAEWVVLQAPSGHRFCVGKPYRSGFEQNAQHWE